MCPFEPLVFCFVLFFSKMKFLERYFGRELLTSSGAEAFELLPRIDALKPLGAVQSKMSCP